MGHKSILHIFIFFIIILSADGHSLACDSCSSCNSLLTGGTQIELNQSISIEGTCILKTTLSNAIINCNGNNITHSGIPNETATAIDITSVNNVIIRNCNIKGFTKGISIESTNFQQSAIQNTTITDCYGSGIKISTSNIKINIINNTISNNCQVFTECAGIEVERSSGQNISYNTIQTGKYGYGIYIYKGSGSSTNNEIRYNNIINNKKSGIDLVGSTFNTIQYNKIRYNSPETQSEITMDSESNNNNIINNALKNQITDSGEANTINSNVYSDLNVGPSNNFLSDYQTVSQAIESSSYYYLIHIFPGTYTENVTIDKPVTISGESKDTTNITSSTDTTLSIMSENTTISNISITSSSRPAIYISSNNINIDNITMSSSGTEAIYIYSHNTTILDSYITGENKGITVYDSGNITFNRLDISSGYDSININNSTDVTAYQCHISGDDGGISIYTSTGANISRCSVRSDNGKAIYTVSSTISTIESNIIDQSQYGIYLEQSSQNTIQNNTLSIIEFNGISADNAHSNTYNTNYIENAMQGMMIYNSSSSIIINNTVTRSTFRALRIDTSNTTIIENNTIRDNIQGLRIVESYSNNVTGNTFINNTEWGINLDFSEENNIWMNNFTDMSNEFNADTNHYCITGLDNYYLNESYDNPPYSCIREISYQMNDTKIYLGHAINISAYTQDGESSYDTINITMMGPSPDYNTSNHTLQLHGTDRIHGIWNFIYSLTTIPGYYSATILSYLESDSDTGYEVLTSTDIIFEVLDLTISTIISTTEYSINDTVTVRTTISDNASEITNITSRVYWNNTLVDTAHTTVSPEDGDMEGYASSQEMSSYTAYTRTNATYRSGNYTVNTTVSAGIEKTSTDYFFVTYGNSAVLLPGQIILAKNKQTSKPFYIYPTYGDIGNISVTFSSSDTSVFNITTQNYTIPYLNIQELSTETVTLDGLGEGYGHINITVTPESGNPSSTSKLIEVRELKLSTNLSSEIIDVTERITLNATIYDNITPIEYMTANITWNSTSKENITLTYVGMIYEDYHMKYRYTGNITATTRSGNYTVYTESKADIEVNDTKEFYVNYGESEITFASETIKIPFNTNRTITLRLRARDGDLKNATVILSSNDTGIVDITDTETYNREIGFIPWDQPNSYPEITYNLSANGIGETNIILNATSPESATTQTIKAINVTGASDTNPPQVSDIITNSTIFMYNLIDHLTIEASIADDSGEPPTKIAEITKPDGYKTNMSMVWTGTTGQYTTSAFTNSTETGNYSIRIYVTDYYGNTNTSETTNFTVTDTYPEVTIDIYDTYNRGENATITIIATDVNGNQVTGINTTMNITYDNITTILLEGNPTETYGYYINTSILGMHYLTANISKDGNTGAANASFNVTNMLDMSFYTSLNTYPQGSWIREFRLYAKYDREDPYLGDLNVSLDCYNDSESHTGIVPLTKSSTNIYTYTTEGNPQCYAPTLSCYTFGIAANITDEYNNTGTGTLYLSTPCASSSTSSSSSGGGGGGGGGASIPYQPGENFTNTIYIENNQTNITRDFTISVDSNNIYITQGKNATIIAKLKNIGDIEEEITVTLTEECFDMPFKSKTLTLNSRNEDELKISVHAPLSVNPSECLITITATSDGMTRKETIKATIDKNSLISDMEELEYKIKDHEKEISSYKASGIDTSALEESLSLLRNYLDESRTHISSDNLQSLESSISSAKSISNEITLTLLGLNTERWLRENKYIIAEITAVILITLYFLIYFIIPYIYLKKDLTALENKEIELKDAEKSVQKQYFMRQLDDRTFNKLISEKHSMLLDTRSEIKHTEEKISLLKRGKLNLKETEHSRYFILSRLKKSIHKESHPEDANNKNTPVSTDTTKELEKERYNIIQTISEAEGNYKNQIITADEYEQIKARNSSKLEAIDQKLASFKTADKKTDNRIRTDESLKKALDRIALKYQAYKITRDKKKIENNIHMLELKDNILKKKESELRTEEHQIEEKIDTLKTEEKNIDEKEKSLTSSE